MKRISRMLGVTLLEIMLVLAIAAMVIVMSVRYYQSASTAQQTNATLSQIQAITAAADSLAQGTGTYSAATSANIAALMPANGMVPAWGSGAITISPSTAGNTYDVKITQVPNGVCIGVKARLSANGHFSKVTCTSTSTKTGDLSYTYTSNI